MTQVIAYTPAQLKVVEDMKNLAVLSVYRDTKNETADLRGEYVCYILSDFRKLIHSWIANPKNAGWVTVVKANKRCTIEFKLECFHVNGVIPPNPTRLLRGEIDYFLSNLYKTGEFIVQDAPEGHEDEKKYLHAKYDLKVLDQLKHHLIGLYAEFVKNRIANLSDLLKTA